MNDPLDLTGVWYGRYTGSAEPQDNSFIGLIEEAGGAIGGAITEPDPEGGGGIRRAMISGRRTGQALYFVKQYTGRWTHSVRYAGRIDGEGTLVNGTWNLDGLVGNFEMQREQFDAEVLEADEESEILMPAEVDWGKEWK
ncbi:MAG: hypothetical protein EOP61_10945 [Sphingomonadales bacterium]|nr:MAG: hypothetical protein EOP61_10945 [Sphingomonadales bacterium]